MLTEAQKRAVNKYRARLKRFTVDFTEGEAELYDHLQRQPKKQTFIKDLIKKDMEETKK